MSGKFPRWIMWFPRGYGCTVPHLSVGTFVEQPDHLAKRLQPPECDKPHRFEFNYYLQRLFWFEHEYEYEHEYELYCHSLCPD